jgi:glycosyl-4,4'-diaponeurosporenoate acyltransferase
MPLFTFNNKTTTILNITAWPVIHLGVAWIATRLSASLVSAPKWLYEPRRWEQEGTVYQKWFHVRKWKGFLPDGAALFEGGFSKKRLLSHDMDHLNRFAEETRRGEIAHWAVIVISPIFALFNRWFVVLIMIGYALMTNLPCIVVQRYNRPKLLRLTQPERTARKL